MLVRWPGVVKPKSTCSAPVHVVDLLATLLEAAGVNSSLPQDHPLDGFSLLPLLRGEWIPARPLYRYRPFYDLKWAATPSAIIRDGSCKLIEYFGDYFEAQDGDRYVTRPRLELYNLKVDLGPYANTTPRLDQEFRGYHSRGQSELRSPARV